MGIGLKRGQMSVDLDGIDEQWVGSGQGELKIEECMEFGLDNEQGYGRMRGCGVGVF